MFFGVPGGGRSKVTKSIPANVVAVGAPCKPIREVTLADRTTYPYHESLKRRNLPFIGQIRAIKTYYCKNRTKNKNKKDSLRAVFFMQENKLFLIIFRITAPAFPA